MFKKFKNENIIFFSLVAILIVNFYFLSFKTINAEWIEQTGSGMRDWWSIDSSSDGSKLVAVALGGYIYTSSDSGFTWIEQTSSGIRNWRSVTSSSDGIKLIATVYGGYIYTSFDSGATWIEQTNLGVRNWMSIASSSDGTKLVATVYGGYIYTSIDSGTTWIEQTDMGLKNWMSSAVSPDGNTFFVAAMDDNIYLSTNDGETWIKRNLDIAFPLFIRSSFDGQKVVIAPAGSWPYLSFDGGETWNMTNVLGGISWISAAVSYDGLKIILAENNGQFLGYIYTSVDGGVIWERQEEAGLRKWLSVASSSDGNKIAAVVQDGYIYTYNTPPIVSDSIITGIAEINQTLTGSYSYSDSEGDLEGTSTFKWLRDDVEIEGATSLTYTTTQDDVGHTLKFEVTPIAETGILQGVATASEGMQIINRAPVVSSLSISGSSTVGNLMTGSYSYSDLEDDLEGTSIYRWLRDDVEIEGATSLTYTTTLADVDHTLKLEVTPIALTGELTGLAVLSEGLLIVEPSRKHSSTGSYIKPTNPLVVSLPTTPELGCEGNNLFNTQNGQPCPLETSTPTYLNFTRTLKLTTPRMTGQDVKDLQKYLNSKGYDAGIPDGVFGSKKTRQAVINFQLANGLIPDGAVGVVTRNYLK